MAGELAQALRAQAAALLALADVAEASPVAPTVADASALVGPADVGVTPRTWRAASARGELSTVRVGRCLLARREDVDAWLATRTVRPRQPAPRTESPADRAVAEARRSGALHVVGGSR